MRGTLEERFWAKVDRRGPEECWPWTAGHNGSNYGTIGGGPGRPRMLLAHRVSAEIAGLPDAETYDHTCHDPEVCNLGVECPHRLCVNPAHLEPLTRVENWRRGGNSGVSFDTGTCSNAHDLSVVGVYVSPAGGRFCRQCRADARARYRASSTRQPGP
ncbi:HNH endonuclease [Microbacterium phage SadLad]|nr:HNH endonuclease [Microbacterium phage SadLad]